MRKTAARSGIGASAADAAPPPTSAPDIPAGNPPLAELLALLLDGIASHASGLAPGIAEALVSTAIGLFSAIPAVIAYNRFARDIDRVAIHQETFIEEFSNILQRSASQPAVAGAT